MLKKLFLISLLSASLIACGGNSANNANTNANVNTNLAAAAGNVANTNTNVNANVNTNTANTAAKPAVDNSPKRISFGKGQNWGTASATLAPNATQLFVISAKTGQTMDVESSSKEVAINLRKGKAQTTEDFGYLNAELQSNGDYIFEVKNTSKKEVKTSIKVTIEGGEPTAKKTDNKAKDEESEIDESDATVMEDDDIPPPPTTPKKKEN
jgi:hypothetical protein